MKKFIALIISVIMMLSLGTHVFADNTTTEKGYEITPADLKLEVGSAVLMEASTGTVLFSQNGELAASPASVTKIMTLLLIAEAVSDEKLALTDKVTISEHASSMGGSQVFLKEGEVMSVEELLKCTVIASANDAAVALAEKLYGSEDAFVRAMNKRANELGMKNTNFENATGLDDSTENHVTSSMDIALMTRELLLHPIILKYSSLWQDSIRNGEFILTNTNRLVRYYDGCNGLKTGSTDRAGYCISATAKRDGMQLIAVIMGAKSRDIRNSAARMLLDFGFSNYALYSEDDTVIEEVPVRCGLNDGTMLYSKGFSRVVNKGDKRSISKLYELPEYLSAPIKAGDVVGKVKYMIGDRMLYESEVYINEDIGKATVFNLFIKALKSIIMGG